MHRMLLPIALILVGTGCHTFQPASVDTVAPGERVRVRVTGAFSDSLATLLQREDARTFEATVVSEAGTSMFLDVPVQQELRGMRFETLNQRVEVPTSAFVDLETKRLDKGRSLLAGGALAAAIGAFVVIELSKESGGGQLPGTPGGPVDAIVSWDPWRAVGWLLGR
ncbi:MAG: hypothetical protein KJO65_05105 [Gemmatimonadetes bacterium]|nr:hypothetical protein [Gemmatimonadota bacterium]